MTLTAHEEICYGNASDEEDVLLFEIDAQPKESQMKEHTIQGELREWARHTLQQSTLFSTLHPNDLDVVLSAGRLWEYEPNERIYREGEAADSFYLLLTGETVMLLQYGDSDALIELGRIRNLQVSGESDILLKQPRAFTLLTLNRTYALQFNESSFSLMMTKLPDFALHLSQSIAERFVIMARSKTPPTIRPEEIGKINPEVLAILPTDFIQNQRIMPLQVKGNVLQVCLANDPTTAQITKMREFLPGVQFQLFRLRPEGFDQVLKSHNLYKPQTPPRVENIDVISDMEVSVGVSNPSMASAPALGGVQTDLLKTLLETLHTLKSEPPKKKPTHHGEKKLSSSEKRVRVGKILPLLQQMAEQGASDLHLCALQKPRWRIDGELVEVPAAKELTENEVYALLEGMMPERCDEEFEEQSHTDFSYTLEGLARYRVNIYREDNGISAALRQIPLSIPSAKDLRLPQGVRMMAELTQGLVLVTGPTGSGKSTTLAAILDSINQKQRKHIITLEDPIEFVHNSQKCLIHQREIGTHATSFDQALRAALREDPDIVLVGEMRDLETMALAIETAHTGHLVLGTLHTNNVVSTMDRIIDMFPSEEQNQVRSSLSEVLRGIICQTLCKRTGGGRVAAFEVLVSNSAVSNIIRQGKTHQLATVMIGKGNLMLNASLEELVKTNLIDPREAMYRAIDKEEMRARLGNRLPAAPAAPAPQGTPSNP